MDTPANSNRPINGLPSIPDLKMIEVEGEVMTLVFKHYEHPDDILRIMADLHCKALAGRIKLFGVPTNVHVDPETIKSHVETFSKVTEKCLMDLRRKAGETAQMPWADAN